MLTNTKKCPHPATRPPQSLGQEHLTCVRCGASVPCPHPPRFRKTEFMGEETFEWCTYCGAVEPFEQ